MKRSRVLAGLVSGVAAATLMGTAPAQAAEHPIPLGFHVKSVHLKKHGLAGKITFTWGCGPDSSHYSMNVQVAQRPPQIAEYASLDGDHFVEGECDGVARVYKVKLVPSTVTTPGVRLKKGPATEYLGGTIDFYSDVEVDEVRIK